MPLVLQDRRTSPDRSLTYAPGPMDLMAGFLGDTVLVNGRPDAVLPVAATLYRLRLLNGSNARVYRLAFADGRSFSVIGTDGGSFDPGRIDVRARRGRLELWEVRNASSGPHPFHVHGTSFQVVSRTSGPLGAQDLGWKDTVLGWPGETVTLAIRFEQYAASTCSIVTASSTRTRG